MGQLTVAETGWIRRFVPKSYLSCQDEKSTKDNNGGHVSIVYWHANKIKTTQQVQ